MNDKLDSERDGAATGTFVWVAVWCPSCAEEWDVLMSPAQRRGDEEANEEYVRCRDCDRLGRWPTAQDDTL